MLPPVTFQSFALIRPIIVTINRPLLWIRAVATVPNKALKQRLAASGAIAKEEGKGYYVGDNVQFAIGQGLLAATPLQLAVAYSVYGNDGTVARFGWKAQNKSLLLFSGEAYNVEMGITSELFQTDRSRLRRNCGSTEFGSLPMSCSRMWTKACVPPGAKLRRRNSS